MPLSDAHTAPPLIFRVPAGSQAERSGPVPRNWMEPMTAPSPIDAPDSSRSVKAADFEQLADDEAIGLVGAHLFGRGRSCHDENDHQNRPNYQHSVPLFPTRQWSLINRLLSTFAVAAYLAANTVNLLHAGRISHTL
jgi:hypothetical protein